MLDQELPEALRGFEIDHVAVAVGDVDRAPAWTALGFERAGEDEELQSEGVRVRMLRSHDALLELLAPLDEGSPVARFLARRGPGLHHLALRVHDLDGVLRVLRASGAEIVEPAPRRGRAGSRVAFLHPRWLGGTLLELVEHD